METKKIVTGTWTVTENTSLYDLIIEEGAKITAPEGKFVCMTVNGVGADMLPGRYHGDILLTVADCYHMAPHALMRINNISRDFNDAVVIDSTKAEVVEAQCVPAIVQGGCVTGEKTEGVYIASSAESFNGVLVHGDGSYTVKDSRVELDGFGANDFMGVGAAVAAIDTADLLIDNCDLTVNGVTRCAVHVGGDSHVTVKNCRLRNTSPDSDWLGDFSWGCGFTGTNRLCQLTDNGSVLYENCEMKTNGWGILSIDGTDKHNEMIVRNCRMELSGPRAHGYGAFCIGGNHVQFDGCDVNVNGYPLMLRGMEDKGRAEILNSRIRGRRFGVLAMGDTHSILTIENSDFNTAKSSMVFKGSATEINIKNTTMVSGNNVIMQLMDNDEGGMTACNFKIPVGEVDEKIPGRDLTTAGEDDIRINLTDCQLSGDFLNSTTNIRACKRSDHAGFGKFHDTVIGSMAHAAVVEHTEDEDDKKGGLPVGMKDLECPKNMGLTLKNTTITGVISSATQKYRDGLTLIDESNRLEMANITQTAAPTVNNGVVVTLDENSAWTVTGTSYITALTIAQGATVAPAEGKRLTMLVNGQETPVAPGTYTGTIVLTVD